MAYRQVLIQTYSALGESSRKSIRARPLPGQGLDADMNVECAAKMRDAHPVGTIFLVKAQLKNKEGGPDFLYTSWQWPYEVVSAAKAKARVAQGGWQ